MSKLRHQSEEVKPSSGAPQSLLRSWIQPHLWEMCSSWPGSRYLNNVALLESLSRAQLRPFIIPIQLLSLCSEMLDLLYDAVNNKSFWMIVTHVDK